MKHHPTNIKQILRVLFFAFCLSGFITKVNAATYYSMGSGNFTTTAKLWSTDSILQTGEPSYTNMSNGLNDFVVRKGHKISIDDSKIKVLSLKINETGMVLATTTSFSIMNITNVSNTSLLIDGILDLGNFNHATLNNAKINNSKGKGEIKIGGVAWSGLSSIAGTFFTTRTNTLTFYNSGYTLTSLPISIPTLTIEGSGIVFPSINTLIGDININTPSHTFTNALNTNLCNIKSNVNGKMTLNTWNLSDKTFIKSGISVIVNLGGSVADSLVNEGNLTLITTASLNTVKFLNKGTLTLGNNAIGDGPTAYSKFQNLVIITNGASIQANNYTFKDVIFQGSIAMANKIYTAENVTLDSTKLTTLTFSGGGTLNVNKTLTMRSISPTLNTKIDITATAVTNITIGGDLVGDGNSTINGGSAGIITLKGVNNSLQTLSGTGSTVIYAGTSKQNMFASTNYQKLTINNSSGVTMKGASTVISALTLTSGRLQIGDYNLALASPNASNSATTSSWIHTDGSGTVTSTVGGTYKYYVGNDTHAQTIQMNNSALIGVNSVRFGTSSISKPASAVGSWYISNSGSGMQLQFINPQGGTLNSGSLVFNKTTSSWKSNITAYGGSPVPTYTSSTPSSGPYEYTLFSCPTLSISGSFTNGSTSNPYSQTVAILSGTAPFLISNITGVPSGLSLSVNNTTGIVTLSGTPTNASTGNIISFNYTDNSGCSFTYTNPAFDILLLDLSPTTVTAATYVSANGFTVNWKACAAPFVVLQVSSDPNFATAEVTVNNLTGSSTNRIVTKSNFISFDPSKIYYARVQTASTNSSTEGQYSNIKIVYVPSKPGSGNALSFNGSQYANVGADTSFNFNQTNNFTIEAWVKLETTAIGKYVIFSKRTQNSPWNGYGILLENTGTNVNFLVDYGNSTSGSVIPGFTLNTWNHIAVSFQGTNYTYYCNGILIGSGAGLSFPKTNDIPRIGNYHNNINYFKGSIDEVRIWDTNLPLNTIQTNMCKKLTGSEANLVGYFNFDEGMGNTSENKAVVATSDATLINAPIWQTSGAPIGDISTFKYAGSSITLTDNDIFKALGYTLGSDQGIHIYKVKQTPNTVSFGSGIDSLQLNQYWGVFPIGITNYTTSYDYTTNVANGKTYEGGILLASRIDNTGTSWNKISTTNADVVNNTIITPLITTGRSEIIAGFGAINNFWNGTINTDWNNAGNWSAGAVPTNSHAVTISSTASNQPIISSNATAQSITIQSAAKLTLNSGVTLAVTNSISNNGTICNGGTISGTIVGTPFVVNPSLSYTANPICSNNAANITLTSSAGATVLWSRASVVGISQPASSGTGTLISEVLTSTNATSTNVLYLATATLGGCTSPQTSISLVVNPTPTAIITGGGTICLGGSSNLTFTLTGVQPWSITYTDGVTPKTINNITSSPYTVSVIPTTTSNFTLTSISSSTCVGTVSGSATVNVNPAPTATLSGGGSICSGSSANLMFSLTGSQPWSLTYTDGISPKTINNILSSPYSVSVNPTTTTTYTLTSINSSTCAGTISGSATVSVNSKPTASISGTSSVCFGSSTNLSVTLTGSQPWSITYDDGSNSTTINGISTSPYVISINPNTTKTYTLISVNDVNCLGIVSGSANVTVNPLPVISPNPDQIVCDGSAFSTINFNSIPLATTFNWTNSVPSIGLGASGTGNSISSFGAVNTSSTQVDAKIIVTPVLNSCIGKSDTLILSVKPKPTLTAVSNQTYCANVNTSQINFGSVPSSGTTYAWTNSNSSIGLPITGSGNVPTFLTSNAGNTPIVSTINVTPTLNGCNGNTLPFTITVNPIPILSAIPNQTYCAGNIVPASNFASNIVGTTFSWTNDNPSIGMIATGVGNYVLFTATNTGSSASVGNFIVTPTANTCVGSTQNFTITVNPQPIATIGFNVSKVCKTGTNPVLSLGSGATAGTFTIPSGLAINQANGIVDLANTAVGTYVVTNTIPANGGCNAVSDTANLTINPSPIAGFNYSSGSVCKTGFNPTIVFKSGAIAGTFSSTPSGLSINTSTGAITLSVSNIGTYKIYNTIAASAGCAATKDSTILTITNSPDATFSYAGSPYCNSNSNPSATFSGGASGGVFSAGAGLVFLNTNTGLVDLKNSTPGTYTVTNTIAAAGCSTATANNTITIQKASVADFTYIGKTFCDNASNPSPSYIGGGVAGNFLANPSGLSINPSTGLVNLSTSTPGKYLVTNTISAIAACPQVSYSDSIIITKLPNTSFTISNAIVCKNSINPTTTLGSGAKAGVFSASPSGLFIDPTSGAIDLFSSNTGTYTVTNTISAAGGCGIVSSTQAFTISPIKNSSYSISACESYFFNGLNRTVSGTYLDTLTSKQGCDSIITLNLTIKQPSTKSLTQTACGSYLFNGLNINVSGIYKDTLMNAQGCDSIITLNLTIKQPSAKSLTQTACGSYLFNGLNINVSGIYKDTLMNAQGCDSIITLNLTINPLPKVKATASVNPVCLGAQTKLIGTGANSYTWDYSKIDNQLFNPTKDTLYTVTGKDVNNCTATDTITIKVQNCTILSATISGSDTICNGDITPLKIDLTGKAPWNVVYNNGFVDKTITGILTSPYFVNVGPPISTTYKLISVTDSLLNTSTNVNGIATIVLQAKPLVNAGNNTLICNNASQIQLNGSVKNAPSKWLTTGSGSFANSQSDTTIYTLSTNDKSLTTIFFYLESNSKFCSKVIDTLEYTLDKYPTANAGFDTTICDNLQIVYLHGKKTGAPTGVTWTSNGSGIFNNQNASNADYTFSTNDLTKSSIAFYMKTTGGLGVCPQVEDTVNVSFKATPKLTFVSQMDTICNGERLGIKVKSSVASASILWSTNDDAGIIPSASGTGDSLSTIPVGLGVLDYQFVATSNGCESKYLLGSVVLKNCLKANYTVNKSIVTNLSDTIIFTSTSTGGTIDSYTWNFGTDANPQTSNSAGPIKVVFSKTGKKVVSLTIKSGALSNTYIDSLVEIKSTSKLQIIVSDSTVEQSKDSVIANLNVINGKKYKWISEPLGAVTFSDSSANPVIKFANGISGKITVKAIVTFNDNSVDSSEVLIVRNGEYQISVTKTKAYFVDSIPVTVNFKGSGPFEFKYQIGKDSSTIKGITTNAYTFNVLSPGQLNVLRIFDKDNVPINYVGGVFPYIVLDTVTSVKHSSTTTFCTAASSKLFVDIKGGKAPYIITIGTNNYNVNAMDTLDFAAGKYTGTITDAAGYVTLNQTFIVDTVKNNFNSIVPKIQGDTAILAQTNAQNLKVNVDLNNLIGLGNNLNYVWTYTQNPAVIVNSLSSETSANTNTIKVNGNVSGTINLQVLVYTGTCSTSVSAPYKIHVKPNIVRNGTKSTGTKIYYNLIGSSPFRIDMTIDSVSTTKLITENEFSIDLLNIKSIGVISIQDSLGVIYYANINEENKAGFVLYNAFSPNNDNKNETFEFGNYMYDNNTKFIKHPWILKIYDRNGFEVFRDDEYKNDWNGGDLVDGVYFWVFINPKVATERLGGFVEIRR